MNGQIGCVADALKKYCTPERKFLSLTSQRSINKFEVLWQGLLRLLYCCCTYLRNWHGYATNIFANHKTQCYRFEFKKVTARNLFQTWENIMTILILNKSSFLSPQIHLSCLYMLSINYSLKFYLVRFTKAISIGIIFDKAIKSAS